MYERCNKVIIEECMHCVCVQTEPTIQYIDDFLLLICIYKRLRLWRTVTLEEMPTPEITRQREIVRKQSELEAKTMDMDATVRKLQMDFQDLDKGVNNSAAKMKRMKALETQLALALPESKRLMYSVKNVFLKQQIFNRAQEAFGKQQQFNEKSNENFQFVNELVEALQQEKMELEKTKKRIVALESKLKRAETKSSEVSGYAEKMKESYEVFKRKVQSAFERQQQFYEKTKNNFETLTALMEAVHQEKTELAAAKAMANMFKQRKPKSNKKRKGMELLKL